MVKKKLYIYIFLSIYFLKRAYGDQGYLTTESIALCRACPLGQNMSKKGDTCNKTHLSD